MDDNRLAKIAEENQTDAKVGHQHQEKTSHIELDKIQDMVP